MKTAFFTKDSLRNTKEITKGVIANFRAVLQPANIVWFGCIVFFCFYKMEGFYANLAFGFVAFYVVTKLNTEGSLIRSVKQLEKELKKKETEK